MVRASAVLALVGLTACQPPPSAPSRVLELYMHPNGLSRCVEEDDDKWRADPSCCPSGWTMAGFSVQAATAFPVGEEQKVTRNLYRHVVCVEGAVGGP